MWYYETTTDTFLIHMERPGEFELWHNHRLVKTYVDCESAAKEVFRKCTGDEAWDETLHEDIPKSLSEWLPGEPQGYEPE
jgi:hypothetical protein